MVTSPLVSIIVPVYNDEEWLSSALESCLRQTESRIEVICVDDASTDTSPALIDAVHRRDSRVRLIAQQRNSSAFQARRTGILAAKADYVIFLDGDDELAPDAVEVALRKARSSLADVVGFGVEIVTNDGAPATRFERALQPQHDELVGEEIISGVFPVGKPAQGHLWRYLFATDLLRRAYSGYSADVTIYRANDLPITFLAMASATKYVSTPEKLYRYRFGRGTSGKRITTVEDFRFYLGAVDSIEGIASRVHEYASADTNVPLLRSYESARLSVVANILKYCVQNSAPDVFGDCIGLLSRRVRDIDILRAAAWYYPDALALLARHLAPAPTREAAVHHVLLTTGNLRTGGVQSVLLEQASELTRAGLKVSIAVHDKRDVEYELPEGVHLLSVEGDNPGEKLAAWDKVLLDSNVDVVIDHHIMYNERWPFYVLAARANGIPTVGWLHSFGLRPLSDARDRSSFLVEYLPLLRDVIVLSPTDVALWKLRGIENTKFLPNPPSSLMKELPHRDRPRELGTGPIELAWWGRLQQSTKQVRALIAVAAELRRLHVDFRLTLVGPDGDDLSAADVLAEADQLGVADAVEVPGALHGDALIDRLSSSHLLVSTSVIEGYQLTILEAQALGMPVAMYELPWLVTVEHNEGVIAVPQGDVVALAREVASLAQDPQRYASLSAKSLRFAEQMHTTDFASLYADLVHGDLDPRYSPEPTLDDARLLLKWTFFYAERAARAQTRTEHRLRRTEGKLEQQRRRNIQLRTGLSFRLGRILTYLPRKLWGR